MFRRNVSGGLRFQTHYTWAHARAKTLTPWDNTLFEWGDTATYDIRHRWVAMAGCQFAGWQVNATANVSSGMAFNITNASSQTNVGGSDRPNLIGDPNLPREQRTVRRWLNTDAFALQAPYTAGNTPPGVMHGPWQKRVDLSITKSLFQSGARSLQIRVELYNIANWANFQPPDGNFGGTTFGSISSTGNAIPRQMQFAIRYRF
jgi:hypothetical protein